MYTIIYYTKYDRGLHLRLFPLADSILVTPRSRGQTKSSRSQYQLEISHVTAILQEVLNDHLIVAKYNVSWIRWDC
jgi:hypothetical protein